METTCDFYGAKVWSSVHVLEGDGGRGVGYGSLFVFSAACYFTSNQVTVFCQNQHDLFDQTSWHSAVNKLCFLGGFCHCIYRWITLFVKRIEPSITGVLCSRREIIIIIIIINYTCLGSNTPDRFPVLILSVTLCSSSSSPG